MKFDANGLVVLLLAVLATWQASLAASKFGKTWSRLIPAAITGLVAGVAIAMNSPFMYIH